MKLSFEPTQLAVAVQATVLRRIIDELTPEGMFGEISLRQRFRDDPMVLVLQAASRAPIRVSFDRDMLYSPARESELRDTVTQLFRSVVGGLS
jgi:hypothetical protein